MEDRANQENAPDRPHLPSGRPEASSYAAAAEAQAEACGRIHQGPSVEALQGLLSSAEHAARSAFVVYMGVWAYAALALVGVRDESFYAIAGSVSLPVLGLQVSPGLFVLGAPLVVLAFWVHMQMYVHYSDMLREQLVAALEADSKKYDWRSALPWIGTLGAVWRGTADDRRSAAVLVAVVAAGKALAISASASVLTVAYALRMVPIRGTSLERPPYAWLAGIASVAIILAAASGVYRTRTCARALTVHRIRRRTATRLIVVVCAVWLLAMAPERICPSEWLTRLRVMGASDLVAAVLIHRSQTTGATFRVRDAFCRANLKGAYLSRRDDAAQTGGAQLAEADLRGAYLTGAYLKNAELSGARLEGAELRWANLDGATLGATHLERAYLTGGSLRGAAIMAAHFERAILDNVHFEGAGIIGSHFEGATFIGAHLDGAFVQDSHFGGAVLGANLLDPLLGEYMGASFKGAYLSGSTFVGAQMIGTNLDGAAVWNGQFGGALMVGVHLEGADFQGSVFGAVNALESSFVPSDVVDAHSRKGTPLPTKHEHQGILTQQEQEHLMEMSQQPVQLGGAIGKYACNLPFKLDGVAVSANALPCLKAQLKALEDTEISGGERSHLAESTVRMTRIAFERLLAEETSSPAVQ